MTVVALQEVTLSSAFAYLSRKLVLCLEDFFYFARCKRLRSWIWTKLWTSRGVVLAY